MDLQLYYSPRSCAFAPHILLYDADANFDVIKVNFDKNEQNSTDYLKVNPKGRVPALLTPKEYSLKPRQYFSILPKHIQIKSLRLAIHFFLHKPKPLTCF